VLATSCGTARHSQSPVSAGLSVLMPVIAVDARWLRPSVTFARCTVAVQGSCARTGVTMAGRGPSTCGPWPPAQAALGRATI
jgi:hypothetical protein